ncbi:MAG: AI-2E family transporter [Pirellulaceae bacterium]
MSRYFNFFVLIGVILLLVVLFYKVMASFFVPLFLALLLVIIFRPVHVWYLERCGKRHAVAAILTTTSILLLVLAPLALLFGLAATEGHTMVRRLSSESFATQALKMRDSTGLTIPAVEELRSVENRLNEMSIAVSRIERDQLLRQIRSAKATNAQMSAAAGLSTEAKEPPAPSLSIPIFSVATTEDAWTYYLFELDKLATTVENEQTLEAEAKTPKEPLPDQVNPTPDSSDQSSDAEAGVDETATNTDATNEEPQTDSLTPALTSEQQYRVMIRAFDNFKTAYCGGKSWAWLKLMANPTPKEAEEYTRAITEFLRVQLLSLGGATTAFLGKLMLGLTIMILALYFFLLDGAGMIKNLRYLSPLDDEHERELIEEFDRVSRAVVLATLLSALAQGALAGIGFFFVGMDNVFLLTMLTICFAMVPFFGAASVWVPVCVWLYFIENRMGAAIGLAIYGFAVVSMVDNVIKPFVLHGQSNIHPLVALLSVLGGVTALGPIGILIGPMIVAFLQTMLKILQRELSQLDQESGDSPKVEFAGAGQIIAEDDMSALPKEASAATKAGTQNPASSSTLPPKPNRSKKKRK